MDSQDILHGLMHIWDQIPRLLGDRWTELLPELEKLLVQIEAAETEEKCTSLTADLIMLIRPYVELRRALKTQIDHFGYEEKVRQSQEATPTPPWWHNWGQPFSGLRRCFAPPLETRYAGIAAPDTMALHEIQSIAVNLRISPRENVSPSIKVIPGRFLEVALHVDEEDFEVLNSPFQKLNVEPDRDTKPLAFQVKSLRPGRKTCYLDFRQNHESISTIHLGIEVLESVGDRQEAGSEGERRLEAELEMEGGFVPPPDLEMQVFARIKNGKTKIHYILNSDVEGVGYQKKIVGPTLGGDVETMLADLLKKVEGIKPAQETDERPRSLEQTRRDLDAVGRQLFDELFNDAMRLAYRGFRDKVRTVVISSNEPWIPWELIKPYDTSATEIIDDDFFCNRFQLTRWFAGDHPPVRKIHVNRFALIEAGQALDEAVLPLIPKEKHILSQMFIEEAGLLDNSPTPASPKKILQLLEQGGVELWHFSSHGDGADLVLDRGRLFSPEDLHGGLLSRISRDRPFVFFNGCETAKLEQGMVNLSGWPVTWITKGRCGAFVGSMWKISDRQSYEFARTFYRALIEGRTIGEATARARAEARKSGRAVNDPTWAAFVVYAHPNAKIEFPSRQMKKDPQP